MIQLKQSKWGRKLVNIFAPPMTYRNSMKTTFENSYIIIVYNVTRQMATTFNNSYCKEVLPLICSVQKGTYIVSYCDLFVYFER